MHRVSLGAGRISNNVDVNRNGVLIATTPNDGHYDDSTGTTGRGWSLDPGMRLRFDGESIMTGVSGQCAQSEGLARQNAGYMGHRC